LRTFFATARPQGVGPIQLPDTPVVPSVRYIAGYFTARSEVDRLT